MTFELEHLPLLSFRAHTVEDQMSSQTSVVVAGSSVVVVGSSVVVGVWPHAVEAA